MLNIISEAIKNIAADTKNHFSHMNTQVSKLMEVIEDYPQSATELMKKLNLKSCVSFRQNYIVPALDKGLINVTKPEKPMSKNQKYFKG